MLIPVLFALLLAPAPVAIYVGPAVRDGFVETDRGVQDSVADLREAMAGDKSVRLVNSEAGADLKLYVVARQKGTGPSGGVGAVSRGSGSAVSGPSGAYVLEAKLVAGTYERPIRVEQNDHTEWHVTWKKMARLVAKDVSVWLAANRERVASR